jgi:hypothetical protein
LASNGRSAVVAPCPEGVSEMSFYQVEQEKILVQMAVEGVSPDIIREMVAL